MAQTVCRNDISVTDSFHIYIAGVIRITFTAPLFELVKTVARVLLKLLCGISCFLQSSPMGRKIIVIHFISSYLTVLLHVYV